MTPAGPRPGPRPDPRPDKLAELHARLADQVAALRTGQDWRHWLTAAARLHDYSFQNTLLILNQRPEATVVAGYETWKTFGRQVNRGEKGIAILAPILRRPVPQTGPPSVPAPAPGADDADEPKPRVIAGFRVTYVWDVAQTSGAPLPEQPPAQLLRGQAPEGLWDALAEIVTDSGLRLERAPTSGANGLTDFGTRTVRVRPDVDDAQAVKTLAHELGHVRLHGPTAEAPITGTMACRGLIEVEAESVAYLVATTHGLDTGAYTFPYVTGWAADVPGHTPEDVVRITGERVLSAARWILARTELAVADLSPPTGAAKRARASVAVAAAADVRGVAVPRDRLLTVHAEAQAFFRSQLERSWAPPYLRGRGLEAALDTPWDAGRAPAGWTTLIDHLRSKGADDDTLLASGLAVRARTGRLIDTFRDRLMLPLHDQDGQVIGFTGRAHPDASRRTPKYLNSPTTALYAKSTHLYGLAETAGTLQRGAVPVLVEGPLDAIAVSTALAGRGVGLAACGTALTSAHLDQLGRHVDLAGRGVVVGFDSDPAGHRAADRAASLLTARGVSAIRAEWAHGDPAADLRAAGAAELTSAVFDRAEPLPAPVERGPSPPARPTHRTATPPSGRRAVR